MPPSDEYSYYSYYSEEETEVTYSYYYTEEEVSSEEEAKVVTVRRRRDIPPPQSDLVDEIEAAIDDLVKDGSIKDAIDNIVGDKPKSDRG